MLTIAGYKAERFPDWVGHCSYNNMTSVSLVFCKNCCMLPSLGQLPSFKSLRIEGFLQLKRIGDEFYKSDSNHHSLPTPFPSLENLVFNNMPCWEEWHVPDPKSFPQLKKLRIGNCPMLNGIFRRRVSSLLDVSKVGKLEFPQQRYDLVDLIIYICDSLTSLWLDIFPNFKDLQIRDCGNLESVSISEPPHATLQRLIISGCSKLVSFGGEGLAAPNLTHLQVTYCDKLEALPRDMKSLLTSLQSLKIYGCPNICRLPKGGLPPNLKSLVVGIGEQQTRDLSWMANLHALTHLEIYGEYCDNIKSYPEVGSLPHLPSLTTLEILHFRKLETLECNELLRLTSLQQLHIYRCPKLENMEGEKLPPSLLLLEVFHCHLLEKHCKNKHQLIWHKISHIPSVKFFE
ncbi:putative disease resistance RPP13-like protein 1 [Arachis hypogaea]|uniref:R13L1/DRL21-like LRR repeat region domain-containing protein n=1 Tax=Arachis hypogaea TaxID=3818 RepID=A0A445EJ45_ARAHY|nr:hypothetical protein Ahy_A02g010026 [Arachis hypogaea]